MELFTETDETDGPTTAPIPDGATPFPIWGWKPESAKKFQDAKGDEIKAQVLNLVRNYQAMDGSDAREMSKKFMDMGLLGVGSVGLKAAWNIIKTTSSPTEATEVYAILEGIRAARPAVVTLAISLFIISVLVLIFLLMQKDAAGLMVILNDTDQDLDLEDITCTHGKVIGIFKENAASENPKPIIPKRLPPIIDPKTKKVVAKGSIQAGFLSVRKMDCALYGTQGALKFKATESFPQGAYLGWSVPLTSICSIGGSNALLVSATYNGSVSQFSDNTGEKGRQEDTSTSTTNAKITGRVNSGSGSNAYYIMNLNLKSQNLKKKKKNLKKCVSS